MLLSAVGFVCEGGDFGSFIISKSLFQHCLMALGAFAFHVSGMGLAAAQARAERMNGSAGGFAWWWSKKSWCLAKDMKYLHFQMNFNKLESLQTCWVSVDLKYSLLLGIPSCTVLLHKKLQRAWRSVRISQGIRSF